MHPPPPQVRFFKSPLIGSLGGPRSLSQYYPVAENSLISSLFLKRKKILKVFRYNDDDKRMLA